MTFRISLVYKLSRRLRIDLRNNRSPRSTDYAIRNTAKISSIPASRVQEIPDIVMDLMELRCTTEVYGEGGVTLHKSAGIDLRRVYGPYGDVTPYKSVVRPHVEFANSVWCPYKIGDSKEIEKIQKRATKLVIKQKNKSYIDRLIYLNL